MVLQYFAKQNSIETQTNSIHFVLAHLGLKGIQIGQLLSTSAAIYTLFKYKSVRRAGSIFLSSSPKTLFIGLTLSYASGAYKMSTKPELNQKRKMLLQRDIGLNTSDDLMIAGIILGAAISLLTQLRLFRSMFVGGYLGMSVYCGNRWILRPLGKDYPFEEFLVK